ncbi:hypothetical protein O3Q37_00235 [Enterococcus lactis]
MIKSIHDEYRIEYLKQHIQQMKIAIEKIRWIALGISMRAPRFSKCYNRRNEKRYAVYLCGQRR